MNAAERDNVDPLGRRSFTSFVTNMTVLPRIQLQRHLPAIHRGELPAECVLPFVHEATHNWCFLTPVGSAAAALSLRARRRAAALVAAGAASHQAIWNVLDDHLRATYVLRALHPLSEGLALFAEHEVVPEDSSHVSAVMQSALAYFEREAVGREGVAGGVNRLLAARGSVDGVRRKATVLEQPLWTGGIRGGYLAGYLTVKNLWLDTVRNCDRFGDSDLFLQYLHAWFFCDWGLVAHLLDDTTADIIATQRIVEHIASRFNAFGNADHEDAADRLEERGRWAPPSGSERWTIGIPDGVEAAARKRLDAVTAEITQPGQGDALTNGAAGLAHEVFSRRPLMLLGRLPVEVHIDSGDVIAIGPERPLVYLPKGYGLNPQDGYGPGVLEVFAAPLSGLKPTVICVWSDGQLVGMGVSHGDLAATGASRPNWSVHDVERLGAKLQRLLYLVLESGDSRGLDITHRLLDSLDRHQFEAFSQTALHIAAEDRVDRLRELMREYGFLPILGGADAVWTLAFLSVMTKLTVQPGLLADLYKSLGGPPGRLEEAFDAVRSATSDAFGVPLVTGDPDRFFVYV
jgi:hypothetical protein